LVVDISGNGIVGTDLSIYKIKTGMKYWLSGTYGIDFCLGYQSSYIASAHSFYYSYNNIFRNYGFLSIGFIF